MCYEARCRQLSEAPVMTGDWLSSRCIPPSKRMSKRENGGDSEDPVEYVWEKKLELCRFLGAQVRWKKKVCVDTGAAL